jgi:hypothetical protein
MNLNDVVRDIFGLIMAISPSLTGGTEEIQ